jgi:tRNA (guanine37-N1)-methyltransferase
MQITVLTLFPEMFTGILGESILRRAIDQGIVSVEFVNFREYAHDKHKTVDDYLFGGGAGMLLKAQPLFEAIEARLAEFGHAHVAMMSPQGRRFNQQIAESYAQLENLILVCGHYEGFDERIRQSVVDDEISLGDFVLTGGELAAMTIIDAVVRLLPSALGNDESAHGDSFSSGLLEYPQYTRPADFRGMKVPDVLLSGNHQMIADWRHRHALYRTFVRRPELLDDYPLSAVDRQLLDGWRRGDFSNIDVLEPPHRTS